jgi:hypothetical protein
LAEGGELRSLRPVKWAHRRGGKPAACFWREGTAWKRKREEGRPSGFFELVERGKEGGGARAGDWQAVERALTLGPHVHVVASGRGMVRIAVRGSSCSGAAARARGGEERG